MVADHRSRWERLFADSEGLGVISKNLVVGVSESKVLKVLNFWLFRRSKSKVRQVQSPCPHYNWL